MAYSEADIRAIYIDRALQVNRWKPANIKREFYIKTLVKEKNKRGFVDYLLFLNDNHLAIIEAKRGDKKPNSGLQKAILYAKELKVRFVYATNGKEIYEYDMVTGKGSFILKFPTLKQLLKKIERKDRSLKESLHITPPNKLTKVTPREFQSSAIDKIIESIAERNKEILIRMAAGTGKTFVIFQVLHKLIKTKWNIEGANREPRILFISDRKDILSQSEEYFKTFSNDIPVNGIYALSDLKSVYSKIGIFFITSQKLLFKKGKLELFRRFPKQFFDIIITYEDHRYLYSHDGEGKKLLNYFQDSIKVDITSSIIEHDELKRIPVFEYSLQDAIEDSIAVPFRIVRFHEIGNYFDTEPETVHGKLVNDEVCSMAERIVQFIKPTEKTIVYCRNQTHALRMCEEINHFRGSINSDYCVRVSSTDGSNVYKIINQFRENIDGMPMALTTVNLLVTGFDMREIKNIAICRPVNSLNELMQIIQRGTRTAENKKYFTVLDFTGSTDLLFNTNI
jgi:type I restriction enzyme, R subunit